MKIYITNVKKISGTKYPEIYSQAFDFYKKIKAKSKRRPYVRSLYFKKNKIFLGVFWQHLSTKNWRDRRRRLKYFACGIDLIENSKFEPESKNDSNNSNEILYRFMGMTKNNETFFIQIKESKNNGQKWLLSIFPKNV